MTSPKVSRHPNVSSSAIYAIGDIHGRADLLERLYAALQADARAPRSVPPKLIFLGDYIDRGPDSDRVIEFILRIPPNEFEVVGLLGNHEAAMLAFIDNPDLGPEWARHGGRETLLAYGIQPPRHVRGWVKAAAAFARALPTRHFKFLSSLRYSYEMGPYFFCHAGVDPGRPLDQQDPEHLLWIREPFLTHSEPLDKVIVHGHTISESVYSDPVRIGLDTGAYRTGSLSAVRLLGEERVFFSATMDSVESWSADPRSHPDQSGGSQDLVAARLRNLGRRALDLAGGVELDVARGIWTEARRLRAGVILQELESRMEDLWLAAYPPSDGRPRAHEEPRVSSGSYAAEREQISAWLSSISISLQVVLGNHLAGAAMSAARGGEIEFAASLIEDIAPASVHRARRDLLRSTELSDYVTQFLAHTPRDESSLGSSGDDELRLVLFLRAAMLPGQA